MAVLTVSNLSKNFGRIQALDNVSFSVPEGSTFGILGPNGSGKTTLLATITDIIRPSSGTYQLFDGAADGHARRRIGTLLETPNFYHYLDAVENLQITTAIKKTGRDEINDVLKRVGLYQRSKYPFKTYSLGMKRRLAIGACLLGSPDVLIFDEPTNGLDPKGIAEIRQLITDMHKEGKTIIMASHLLYEVEKVCTHVAILKNGHLITAGDVGSILVKEVVVEVATSDNAGLITALQGFEGVIRIEKDQEYVLVHLPAGTTDPAKLNEYCHQKGIVLNHLTIRKKSLESKFMELTQN